MSIYQTQPTSKPRKNIDDNEWNAWNETGQNKPGLYRHPNADADGKVGSEGKFVVTDDQGVGGIDALEHGFVFERPLIAEDLAKKGSKNPQADLEKATANYYRAEAEKKIAEVKAQPSLSAIKRQEKIDKILESQKKQLATQAKADLGIEKKTIIV